MFILLRGIAPARGRPVAGPWPARGLDEWVIVRGPWPARGQAARTNQTWINMERTSRNGI